jgi:hypothetical protein
MTPRRMLALLLIFSFLLLGVGAASAPAATRKLCASRANLYDSPGGIVVGRLHRPQRVTIVRRSANRRWVHVRARTGLSGWMLAGALCRRG